MSSCDDKVSTASSERYSVAETGNIARAKILLYLPRNALTIKIIMVDLV